jgi:formylmethanofuran dehydrogenase subunit A
VGGDPRFIIKTQVVDVCIKDGKEVGISSVISEESQPEVKIDSFSADQIEQFLKDHGILPTVDEHSEEL